MPVKVLLGVTGCIAAYKSCEILRGLQKAGVDVEVVMTSHAAEFVNSGTFSALSGKPTRSSNFGDDEDAIPHIRLAEDCDLFLIAPCTGNVLGKIANGIADDLLTTCALAAHDKLAIAPAMNVHMYESPSVQANIATLRKRGVKILDADSGYLACGDVGKGRLAEVDAIVEVTLSILAQRTGNAGRLQGKMVLVTAGPTIEWIDPVRYISNPSTGKMGYAVAEAARDEGAQVTLVSGPVSLDAPEGVNVVSVQTAQEMLGACEAAFADSDIAVLTAAVSDYRPKTVASRKLKKATDAEALSSIEMVENPDILATLGHAKTPGQFVIGFAAETNDVVENARKKLDSKGADMIVANQVGDGKGFGADDDAAVFVSASSDVELPSMDKRELAAKIIEVACDNFQVC